MAEIRKPRYKEPLSRRGRERLQKVYFSFDLVTGLLALVMVVAVLCCWGQPYELGARQPSGFALWFLLFAAYVPLEIIGIFNWCFGIQDTALMKFLVSDHQALGMGLINLVMLAVVWALIRFWLGKRYGVNFIRAAVHFLAIFLAWGIFQLGCMAAMEIWSRGGFSPLHRHLQREAEPEKVIVVSPGNESGK